MAGTEDPLLLPPFNVLIVISALLSFAVTLLAVAAVLVVSGGGETIVGGGAHADAKGGADNDDDKDDPFAFSPGGARVIGEQGDECKDASRNGVRVRPSEVETMLKFIGHNLRRVATVGISST